MTKLEIKQKAVVDTEAAKDAVFAAYDAWVKAKLERLKEKVVDTKAAWDAARTGAAADYAAWVKSRREHLAMSELEHLAMSRRAKRPKVWTMIAEECEQRGMKVLYVDSDSTYVQGLSYDLIIIDEFVDVAKEQQDNG